MTRAAPREAARLRGPRTSRRRRGAPTSRSTGPTREIARRCSAMRPRVQGRRTRGARRRGDALPLRPGAACGARVEAAMVSSRRGSITTRATACRVTCSRRRRRRCRPPNRSRPSHAAESRAASPSTTHSRKPSTCARPRSSSPRRQRAGRCRPPTTMTGFATSVIACGCEAGIDRELAAERDAGRPPGVRVLPVRGLDGGAAEAAAQPRRPMRADQPRLGLLRRAARRRGEAQARRRDPAFSATAGRSPRSSATAATGACR